MYSEKPAENRLRKIHWMAAAALMTAVTCILAPMSIPIGPVPISLTNLVIFLSLYLLGWRRGTVSCLAYILIGAVGLPVFSGFAGGVGKLAGATGGYIIGFVPMAVIAGLAIDQSRNRVVQAAAMIAGTAVCYGFGTAWFCFVMDSTPLAALSLCVFPFIPGDLVKIAVALSVGPVIRDRLDRAGLSPR